MPNNSERGLMIIAIAEAVVAALEEYGAELAFAPEFDLPKLAVRRVVVVPQAQEYKVVSRAGQEETYRIDIGVLQRAKESELKPLLALTEGIGMMFLRKKLADAICMGVEFNPLYSAEHLRERNQFVGVVALTFKAVRQ